MYVKKSQRVIRLALFNYGTDTTVLITGSSCAQNLCAQAEAKRVRIMRYSPLATTQ